MASQSRRPRWSLRALPLIAVVALVLAVAPAALGAPTPPPVGFGVDISKDYVSATMPNDYTAVGTQYYSYQTLLPSTTYYVKPAFCQGAYDAATARGVIWNAATGTWVRASDAWSACPQFTTDAAGSIASTWTYIAFGDDSQSGSWTLYFVARPVNGTDSDAVLGTKTAAINVLDMKTTGAWIHNGVSIYGGGLTRAEVDATSTNGGTQGNTLALYQTQVTGAADGASSIIPAAALTGGFRLWMPIPNPGYNAVNVGGDIYVNINRKALTAVSPINPSFTNVTHFAVPLADTEMAVGLTVDADQTPPAAPASLTATGAKTDVELSWPAATDNTGVTAYRVYRWTARPDNVTYSPEHKLIATVAPAGDGTGSYTDSDAALVADTFYYYEVRAVDAASNIGPRSATAHALFGDEPPVTTATGLAATATAGWTNAASPVFSLSATDTDQTKVDATWYTVNEGADVLWVANPVAAAGLTEGSNPISHWSVDKAGLEETVQTGYINIDRTAPVTTVSGVPSGWVKRAAELRFTTTAAAGEAPIAYTEYKVAGGAWTRGTRVTVSRQGETVVEYRSADTAGNVEAAQSCVVRVDSVGPKVVAYGPVTAWKGGNVRFTFRVSDVSGPVSVKIGVTRYGHRVATYELGMKPVGRKAAGTVVCTLPVARYSWRVVVTDSAGNTARTTAQVLRVLPGARAGQ
jgi:hypothetical protein